MSRKPDPKTPRPTATAPKRLSATFFMTLDGVVEDPAWSFPYWNDEVRDFKAEESERSDALLLGRVTYEQFAKVWPTSKDEGAPYFNNVKKYVVSTTRTRDVWKNTTFLQKDPAAAIRKIKAEGTGHMIVHGSISLTQWLIRERLLDELRLLLYPILLGSGRRLFDGDQLKAEFELVSSRATSNGVLALVYRPKKSA